MKSGRTIFLHPLLFAVFPVLFIFSSNLGSFRIAELLVPSLAAMALAALIWTGLAFLTKNVAKSAITVSLLALFFFSYGHLASAVRAVAGAHLGQYARLDMVLIPCCAVAFALCMYLLWRARGPLAVLTRSLNIASLALVLISASRICIYEVQAAEMRRAAVAFAERTDVTVTRPAQPPNIYYIILDAYGRQDKLQELYGYDNGPFVDFLRSRGFFVAGKSRANYSHTNQSIASSMSFEYLAGLSGSFSEIDRTPLMDMLGKSRIVSVLKGMGYKVVSFNDRYEIYDADVYMAPPAQSEFERGLLNTTIATSAQKERAKDRAQIEFVFEHLPSAATPSGPCFVYAHIMAPHPPFVFTADGGDPGYRTYTGNGSGNHIITRGGITRNECIAEYRAQLSYVNVLLRRAVERILASSAAPPVIILQGDHGPCAFLCHEDEDRTYLGDRMSILNAYYFPNGKAASLYDSVTPVNSFRLVLNAYFGAHCSLAEDRSYFVPLDKPWQARDVTDFVDSPRDRERLLMLERMNYFPRARRRPVATEDPNASPHDAIRTDVPETKDAKPSPPLAPTP